MKTIVGVIVAVIVMLGAAGAGYWFQHARQQAPAVLSGDPDRHSAVIGQSRPDFSLPDMNGELQALNRWDGKILAVNFWATWCAPCEKEIPDFVELQDKYRDAGVMFIGIALDQVEAVAEFAERHEMNYPILIGEQGVIDAARAFGNDIGALPYTAFVDREGRIVHTHYGLMEGAEVDALLEQLVGNDDESG